MGAAHPPGRDHSCLLETVSCLGGGKVLIWHLQVQALRCLARGGAHTPFVVWVPCVTLTLLLPHLSPPGHPESLDVPRGHQHELDMWLPTLASPTHGTGVALSRLGILVFRAHKPGHLGKMFARTQTGKISSQASHHPSVPLRARLQPELAYEPGPSHCPQPDSRHPQRVRTRFWLSCFLIFIQGLRFG